MSDTGPPGIGVTTSATAGGALRRRDRRLRGHAADPPQAHQQNLRFSNELNRPVSPAPSVSSNSSEFSEATMAEVEAALRNHNPYNYDKWPEWKLAGDLGGVPYWLSVYSRSRSPGWQFRAEDDDVFLEQREPSDDEEDIFAKQRDPYVNEEYRVAYDDSKMRQCITRSRHASPTMHPPPPSPPSDVCTSNPGGRHMSQQIHDSALPSPSSPLSSSSSRSLHHTSQRRRRPDRRPSSHLRSTRTRISTISATTSTNPSPSKTTNTSTCATAVLGPQLTHTTLPSTNTTAPTPIPTHRNSHRITKTRQRQVQTQSRQSRQDQKTGGGRQNKNREWT